MSVWRRGFGVWACVWGLSLGASGAVAQDAPGSTGTSGTATEPTEPRGDLELGAGRTLNDHPFVPSLLIPFPFVATRVSSNTGFGMISADLGADAVAAGFPESVTAALFNQQLEVGVAIADRVAIVIQPAATVFVGTDEDSGLYVGAGATGQGTGGVAVKVLETEQFYLSGILAGRVSFGAKLSPYNFVVEALDTGAINADTLTADYTEWAVIPGVSAAWAPTEVVGLQAGLTFDLSSYKAENVEGEFEPSLGVGVAVSVDANTLFAPVALLVGYALDADLSGGSDPAHQMEVGLFYSGVRALNVGAAFAATLGDGDETITYGQLRLAHYW